MFGSSDVYSTNILVVELDFMKNTNWWGIGPRRSGPTLYSGPLELGMGLELFAVRLPAILSFRDKLVLQLVDFGDLKLQSRCNFLSKADREYVR